MLLNSYAYLFIITFALRDSLKLLLFNVQRLKHTVRRLPTHIQVTIAQRGSRASFIQPHTAIRSWPILLHGRCIAINGDLYVFWWPLAVEISMLN